jgi:hypothetical protein
VSTAAKKPSELGVGVLSIDHDWGTRGSRRVTKYFGYPDLSVFTHNEIRFRDEKNEL